LELATRMERVLTAVHFTLNLPSGKSFARGDKGRGGRTLKLAIGWRESLDFSGY
jgi:hypothetical protein